MTACTLVPPSWAVSLRTDSFNSALIIPSIVPPIPPIISPLLPAHKTTEILLPHSPCHQGSLIVPQVALGEQWVSLLCCSQRYLRREFLHISSYSSKCAAPHYVHLQIHHVPGLLEWHNHHQQPDLLACVVLSLVSRWSWCSVVFLCCNTVL